MVDVAEPVQVVSSDRLFEPESVLAQLPPAVLLAIMVFVAVTETGS